MVHKINHPLVWGALMMAIGALGGLYVAASLGAHVAVFGGLALVGLAAVAASWMVRARWRAVSAPMRFRVVVVGLISYGVILALLAAFTQSLAFAPFIALFVGGLVMTAGLNAAGLMGGAGAAAR